MRSFANNVFTLHSKYHIIKEIQIAIHTDFYYSLFGDNGCITSEVVSSSICSI